MDIKLEMKDSISKLRIIKLHGLPIDERPDASIYINTVTHKGDRERYSETTFELNPEHVNQLIKCLQGIVGGGKNCY